jgi:hypothetical protein
MNFTGTEYLLGVVLAYVLGYLAGQATAKHQQAEKERAAALVKENK